MRGQWVRRFAALVIAVGVVGIWDSVRYDLIPKRLVPVHEDFLYRSGQISPALIGAVMDDYGFDSVVTLVAYDDGRVDHQTERRAALERGIPWQSLPLRGNGTGDPEHYVAAMKEIHRVRQEGGRVLVHCASGVRRAAGVPSVYRVLVEGDAPERVYAEELDRFVGPFRLWGPRPAYESQILPYLNEHMEYFAARLVEEGVLAELPHPIPQFAPPSRHVSG